MVTMGKQLEQATSEYLSNLLCYIPAPTHAVLDVHS
jgi:hypothetical protein